MAGIEPVIKSFYLFIIKALFSFIKPDRDNCKKGKTLTENFDRCSENVPDVIISHKHFRVDIPKAEKLYEKIKRFSFPEEIENQNGQNARAVIVAKAQNSKNIA